MPTYHYRCTACGHQFDAVQRFADNPLTDCPECGEAIKRVIQPVGVVFKGSGWYINDSRKKETPAASAPTSDAAAGDGAAKPAKSETPAAAKSEAKPAVAAAAD